MNVVDLHNHLIPGVDDGAQSLEEALSALDEFAANGVSAIVSTPHVAGSITSDAAALTARMREIDEAFVRLCDQPQVSGIRIERGVELLLDVPEPQLSDPRLRLAGTQFVLMEFPGMMVPPNSARAVRQLSGAGVTPVIAHPERYLGMAESVEVANEWRAAGAYLQLNGGSLLGRYGANARAAAFELLRRGWADYLSSDYHARGRSQVAQYRALLERLNGYEQALTLMQTNPARLLEGQAPLPVQPLRPRRTVWSRVAAVFRT